MKSRLLPPPISDDVESDELAPSPVYSRREIDRSIEVDDAEADVETLASKAPPEPSAPTSVPATAHAPTVSDRPTGRFAVVAMLLACVTSAGFFLWSTFLRDAAYGVVTGKVTTVSPPWSGTLTAVYVRAGDTVRQGDVLAIVNDPDLQASIDRLGDDLRSAQAQLDAQAALLSLAARDRGNAAEEIRADYYDLRGELLAEQSRRDEISSKLQRRQEMAKRHAYSEEEIESLRFVKQGLTDKIDNLKQAAAALETRLETLPANQQDTAQLKPWLAKIENFQAETHRLREKQRRGTLRAPVGGTIVDVACHVGERATPTQPLLELLPSDSLELVLYIKQNQAAAYQKGQSVKVVVEPISEPIICKVTRLGQRYEKPQSHVAGRYRPEEKLLPVYLTPTSKMPEGTQLRIGSTLRLPTTLFAP